VGTKPPGKKMAEAYASAHAHPRLFDLRNKRARGFLSIPRVLFISATCSKVFGLFSKRNKPKRGVQPHPPLAIHLCNVLPGILSFSRNKPIRGVQPHPPLAIHLCNMLPGILSFSKRNKPKRGDQPHPPLCLSSLPHATGYSGLFHKSLTSFGI
jgi:hypothetical protein